MATNKTVFFLIGILLVVLATGGFAASIIKLIIKEYPDTAVPNLIISGLSLSFMFALWYYKKKAA